MAIDSSVEAVVMATDSAMSALPREHHRLEKEPPGELVTTNNAIASTRDGLNIWTTVCTRVRTGVGGHGWARA